MFPAQQALGKQQFAVDTDNVEQLLAAGTDVMGNRLQPGGGQAVRQLLQQRPDVRVTHQGNPLLSFLRIDQQRRQPHIERDLAVVADPFRRLRDDQPAELRRGERPPVHD